MPLAKLRKELEKTWNSLDIWTMNNVAIAPRDELDRAYTAQRVMKESIEAWDTQGVEAVISLGKERIQSIETLMKDLPSFVSSVNCRRTSELETWERIVSTLSRIAGRGQEKSKRVKSRITRINSKAGIWFAPVVTHILLEGKELLLKISA